MKFLVNILLALFVNTCCVKLLAQPVLIKEKATDSLQAKIVLIGDAGALVNGKATVLDAIKNQFKLDEKTTVLFLGDNLYSYGLPDETYQRYNEIKAALDSQINLIKGTKAKAIMIPGNHDWANGAPEGFENVTRQQKYVDKFSNQNFEFYPKDGCPGPINVKISKDVVLVIMDSQWWLHTQDKPGVESDCNQKTEEEVLEELKDVLNKNYNKLVVIAMHHPFKSNGPHGGYYTLKQHIFPFTESHPNLYIPLPVIGSIYPITRGIFGTKQDIHHPNYQNMINKITKAIKLHPNVIMVAGHEHNLQYIKDSSINYVISGSGCKTTRVSKSKDAAYVKQNLGFAALSIYKNKTVDLDFFVVNKGNSDSIKNDYHATIVDFSKLPTIEVKDTVTAEYVYKNTVAAPASSYYNKNLTGLKKWFNGNNYRKEWSTPIELKVFNIKKEKGGFTIEGMGGGNQTKSLKLVDKEGKPWALRTLDKDPEKVVPENLKNTIASEIVRDMISASHPYATGVIPYLAEAVDILEPKREFFFVPDDPTFGYYKPYFANKVCLLERKDPNNQDNKSSFKLIEKMREDNDQTVDQVKVLNARLLDMVIGDWDRHFDQWRWAATDTGKGKTYYPLPKDRDQAFFKSDGKLIKLMTKQLIYMKGFHKNMGSLSDLNWEMKDFDRLFLNGIDRKTWDSVVVAFTQKLTDEKIRTAIKNLPPEIYAIRGKQTEDVLIERRNQLREKSLKYYDFITKEVTITGSNENELYKISNDANNNTVVTGYAIKKKNADTSFVTYHRVFNPTETKEIRIFGFNGEDVFVVDSNTHSKIKMRFIGGKGKDTFLINAPVKAHLYDVTTEENYANNHYAKNHFSSNYQVNKYELRSYNYNKTQFPKITLGYNGDDGLLAGAGFIFKKYKFRREPFASEHKLNALFAITQKGMQVKYNGTFHQVIGKTGILVNAKLNNPGINNFFGIGNETQIIQPKKYYLARYKTAEAEVLFNTKQEDKVLSFIYGPTIYHYWNRNINNQNLVLENPKNIGLDSSDVFTKHTYAGAKVGVIVDNINNALVPNSGINWNTFLTYEKGISRNTTNDVAKFQTDMTVYASRKSKPRVVGVIKLGFGKIFTDSTKYFQTLTLGQNNNLRGFLRNRFAGNQLAYGSLEFRIKLLENKSHFLPGPIGIIVFNDLGRVWSKIEQSNTWHNSYGGGLYFIPFNSVIVAATVATAGTDKHVLNFSLGSKFNITF